MCLAFFLTVRLTKCSGFLSMCAPEHLQITLGERRHIKHKHQYAGVLGVLSKLQAHLFSVVEFLSGKTRKNREVSKKLILGILINKPDSIFQNYFFRAPNGRQYSGKFPVDLKEPNLLSHGWKVCKQVVPGTLLGEVHGVGTRRTSGTHAKPTAAVTGIQECIMQEFAVMHFAVA